LGGCAASSCWGLGPAWLAGWRAGYRVRQWVVWCVFQSCFPLPCLAFLPLITTSIRRGRVGWLPLFPFLSFPLLALYRLDSTNRTDEKPCVYSLCSLGCSLHACAWRLHCSMLGMKVVRLSRIPRRAVPLCLARRRRIGPFTMSSGCLVQLSCLCFWVRESGVVVVVVVRNDMR
jgi:hypothetical protein